MTVRQFFIGLIMLALGFHMTWKTDAYMGFMGRNEWAEQKLGPGGTRLMYKIIGIFICFFGILGVTGQLSGLAEGAAMTVFGSKK